MLRLLSANKGMHVEYLQFDVQTTSNELALPNLYKAQKYPKAEQQSHMRNMQEKMQ